MPDTNDLASRIDAEFAAVEEKTKRFQAEQMEGYRERQKRLEQLGKLFDQMGELWKTRREFEKQQGIAAK